MAEKAADIQTLAPRLSYVEDLAAWLKDNRGEGGSGDDPSPLLKKLWIQLLYGATTDGAFHDDPWSHNDSIYPGLPNPISLHQTIFGADPQNALNCQTDQGLYGHVFHADRDYWNTTEYAGAQPLADEVFGTDGTYVGELRAGGMSLAEAIFREPSKYPRTAAKTIIGRLETLENDIEESLDEIRSELASIRSRLSAGGL
jgi:hypothetical protein